MQYRNNSRPDLKKAGSENKYLLLINLLKAVSYSERKVNLFSSPVNEIHLRVYPLLVEVIMTIRIVKGQFLCLLTFTNIGFNPEFIQACIIYLFFKLLKNMPPSVV